VKDSSKDLIFDEKSKHFRCVVLVVHVPVLVVTKVERVVMSMKGTTNSSIELNVVYMMTDSPNFYLM
jgi:hypothetical protein